MNLVVKSLAKAHHRCPLPVGDVGGWSAVVLGSLFLESIFWVNLGQNFTLGVPKVLNYRSVIQIKRSIMVRGCTYCVAECDLDFSWPLVEHSASSRAEKRTKSSLFEVFRCL